MQTDHPPQNLVEVIDAMRAAAAAGEAEAGPDDGEVTVRDILRHVGDRSFAPTLLVPALILVSPLSGIPGLPTIGSILVVLIALQALFGHSHVWLPEFLMRRKVAAHRLDGALNYLERPASWVDRHSHGRWRLMSLRPVRILTLITILLVAVTWPLLELLPLVTSIGAFAVSLFAIGLFTRDGVYTAAGFVFVGCLVATFFYVGG